MYRANGVELTGSQYELLERIVDCYDDPLKGVKGLESVLAARWDASYADGKMDRTFQALINKGLIVGKVEARGLRLTEITQDGLDFVHDYEEDKADKRKKLWSNRGFQLFLSFITFILSVIGGWVSGHFF